MFFFQAYSLGITLFWPKNKWPVQILNFVLFSKFKLKKVEFKINLIFLDIQIKVDDSILVSGFGPV